VPHWPRGPSLSLLQGAERDSPLPTRVSVTGVPKGVRVSVWRASLQVNTADKLKVYDILRADKIVIESAALAYIKEFYGPKPELAAAAV
jgi:ribosomal protein L4